MMKPLFIIIFVFVLSLSLLAQESDKDNFTNKHEISMSVDDIFSSKGIDYNPYEVSPDYNDLYKFYTYDINLTRMGFGYKYHFAKSAIRSKITLSIKKDENNPNSIIKEKLYFQMYEVFLGYEFHKNLNKTQIFYGADIFYNNYDINADYINTTVGSETSELYTYNKIGIGVSPILGVKFFISSMISVSTEVKFMMEKYEGKFNLDYSPSTFSYHTNFNGNNFKMGPLGNVSVNIHF